MNDPVTDDSLGPLLDAFARRRPDGETTDRTAPAAAPPVPGRLGDYRIVREVGRGGMGVVYEAEQVSLGRRVALKVLPPHAARDSALLERFRREAKAAARLHHTNIVPVFEVGQDGDIAFFAMQFIVGRGLDRVIAEQRRHSQEGPTPAAAVAVDSPTSPELPAGAAPAETASPSAGGARPPDTSALAARPAQHWRTAAALARQAAEALAYAHSRGIVHRDVKPSNLLLDGAGVLWVADFGLAKAEGDDLTQTGTLLGTLRYMAPERFRGQGDARADVYALGLTLYELLVLAPAYACSDPLQLVEQVKNWDPVRPRDLDPAIPRDLETVCLKAMAKEPSRRYQTAAEMAEDLRRFLADEPIRARRVGAAERLGRWCRRNPLVAALAASAALSLAAGTAVAWYWALRAGDSAELARANEKTAKENEQTATKSARQLEQANDKVSREGEAKDDALKQLRTTLQQLRATTYRAQVRVAQQAIDEDNGGRARELLGAYLPRPGEEDLRGAEWYFVSAARDTSLLTLRGHSGPVLDLALRPDGARLATASADGTVKVWDAVSGRELLTCKGFKAEVWSVAFSPDGKRLATLGAWGELKVFDAANGRALQNYTWHSGDLEPHHPLGRSGSVAYSPDGVFLANVPAHAAAFVRPSLLDWPHRSIGEVMRRPNVPQSGEVWSGPSGLAYSPDGRRLATWLQGHLKVWDTTSALQLWDARNTDIPWVMHAAFSPDGKRLAGSGKLGEMRVWDAADGQKLLAWSAGGDEIAAVAYDRPDGQRLASAAGGNTVKLWDAASGRLLGTLGGQAGPVAALAFYPDNRRLAGASLDGTVKVWDVGPIRAAPGKAGADGEPTGFVCSQDGARRASGFRNGKVKVWDARTGAELLTLAGIPDRNVVDHVRFGPDGTRLAAVTGDGSFKLWDARTGRELAAWRHPQVYSLGLAFAPDGTRLAILGGEKGGHFLYLYDTRDGGVLARRGLPLWLPGTTHTSFTFSPDGTRLAVPQPRGSVIVYDARSLEPVRTLTTGTADYELACLSPAYSPDGTRLAAGSSDRTVTVWDTAGGNSLFQLKGHTEAVKGVAFSPDGSRLVSWTAGRTVKLWDPHSGEEVLTLRQREDVVGVAFTPDGGRLAVMLKDGTVQTWGTGDGARLALPVLDRRLALDPDDWAARRERAELLAGRGEWERAAADFADLAARAGDKAPPWYDSGWWLTRAGEADEEAFLAAVPRPPAPATIAADQAPHFWPAPRDVNDFIELPRQPDVYAVLWVYARGAQERVAELGPGAQPCCWLNGAAVHVSGPDLEAADSAVTVRLALRDGWNTFVARPSPDAGLPFLRIRLGRP